MELLFVVLNPLLSYLARYLLSGQGQLHYHSAALYTLWHMLASLLVGAALGPRDVLAAKGSIVPLGMLGMVEALSIVTNNMALATCSVFTNQSIKACVPLLLLVLNVRPSELKTIHMSIIFGASAVCGLLSHTTGHMAESLSIYNGVALSICSLLFVVVRMRLAQYLLHDKRLPRHVVLFYQSVGAIPILLLLAIFSDAFAAPVSTPTVVYLIVSALVAATYNAAYVAVSAAYVAHTVSLIATGRQGLVLLVSMLFDLKLSLCSLLLVVQLVLTLGWYALSGAEARAGVWTRLLTNKSPSRALLPFKYLVCLIAVLSMPFGYQAATTRAAAPLATFNVTVNCLGGFDGSADYEIMVSRYNEDNLETLLRAASIMRVPITFQQSVPDVKVEAPADIAHATSLILEHAEREPRCVRLAFNTNLMDEANGYLSYIIDRYDTLPGSVVMIKGSFKDFVQHPTDDIILEFARGLNQTRHVPYASLPTNIAWENPACANHLLNFERALADIWDEPIELTPPSTHCFLKAQMVVSRDSLRRWPRLFYERLRQTGLTVNCPEWETTGWCHTESFTQQVTTAPHRFRHGALKGRQWLQFYLEWGGFQSLLGGADADVDNSLCRLGDDEFCSSMTRLFDYKEKAPDSRGFLEKLQAYFLGL